MKRFSAFLSLLSLVILACGGQPTPPPAPRVSYFDSGNTAYGFFPSPPEITLESVMQLYRDIHDHGDFVLIQQNIPWKEFEIDVEGESKTRTDIINQSILAHRNGLEAIFVIDALNGLNRSEFSGLPSEWEAGFSNPKVRTAFKNFALWVVRTFNPRYLGLASEINTYMDAHPQDASNFVSLYNETYHLVKNEAPQTRVFVTFQWDDLNNMFPQPEEGDREKFDINWEQVEVFEPNLDIWAISTYPYFVFSSGSDIPVDYFSPLHLRTSKPLAIAEGGFTSVETGPFTGSPDDQLAYLKAIHDQLGPRLAFWVNTLLDDFDIKSYAAFMEADGRNSQDAETLALFAHIGLRNFDGSPKPALDYWDSMRRR